MRRFLLLPLWLMISLPVFSQNVSETSRSWTAFSQSMEITADSTKQFKVVAHVKVETEDEEAWAGVWARVDNKADQGSGFFDNMGNRPITSDEWQAYTIEGTIDEKSDKLFFGGLCLNNGRFYFDQFELYIEDDQGEFQLIDIENANFETEITDRLVPGWAPGVTADQVVVKEFTFSSTEDRVEGDYALLVEGTGISDDTGSMEADFPNIGIAISTLYLLILLFTFLTYSSSTERDQWPIYARIGFRFSFIYFLFVIFFHNNGAFPYFEVIAEIPLDLMQQFAPWFGENVLGLGYKVSTGPNGSGDTSYDYLVVLIGFLTSILGTSIWSAFDRKRPNYKTLYYWLTTGIRYYVGLMLISYGLVKVIQLQFSAPGLSRLLQPYGESSPMGLAWTFLGFSEGYNMFMGIAEVMAVFLLFRRTLTFGAVITLMTTMNVMAVNYFYDVPVKLLSTHLVLMTLFLLARDLRKVMQFLVTSLPVEQLTLIPRPSFRRWLNLSLKVVKGALLVYGLGYGLYSALDARTLYGTEVPRPPLYGVYQVTNCTINGDTLTDYRSDRLWKEMIIQREGGLRIRTMNGQSSYYQTDIDTAAQIISMTSTSGQSDPFDLTYTKTESTLDYTFIQEGDTISGQTNRLGQEDFLLTNRGFHWISEFPFNR